MINALREHKYYKPVSWAFVVIMLLAIFWFSSQPGENLDTGLGIISAIKEWLAQTATNLFGHEVDISPVGHFIEYLLLGLALTNALSLHIGHKTNRGLLLVCVLAVVFASAYGVTDELHQIFTPDRSCDPMDWLVDTFAAAFGAATMAHVLFHYCRD